MDETADVLLAYKMNGKELAPDHGYPIRLIVPGYIGGRMVRRERARKGEVGRTRTRRSFPWHWCFSHPIVRVSWTVPAAVVLHTIFF